MLSLARIKPIYLKQNLKCSFNLNRHVLIDRERSSGQLSSLNQFRDFSIRETSISVTESIANSSYVDYTQKALINLHDFTGLPWWIEIILASAAMRVALLPFYWYERRITYIYETKAVPEMNKKIEKIREQTRRKLQLREFRNEKNAQRYFLNQQAMAKKELYIKYNIHPMKRVICVLAPFPFWVVMSFSIAGLCSSLKQMQIVNTNSILENINFTKQQAQTEGFLWFKDLTLPDQYCILPTIFLTVFLLSIEYNIHIRRYNWIEDTKLIKILTNVGRSLSLVLFFASMSAPSGLALYWTSNAVTVFAQNVMLMNQNVKKALQIRDTSQSKKNPGLGSFKEHLFGKFKNGFHIVKNKFTN